jgi:hypothetical protein
VTAPPYPSLDQHREERHRTRLPLLVLAVVAIAAVVAAGVLAGIAFLGPRQAPPATGTGPSPASPGPSAAGTAAAAAPTGLKLRDDGDIVHLTWTDPSGGTVPFFVEYGPPGGQLKIMTRVSPGETTFPVVGLNPRLNYCFSVVAVYSTTVVAPSDLVCTQRNSSGASPSR